METACPGGMGWGGVWEGYAWRDGVYDGMMWWCVSLSGRGELVDAVLGGWRDSEREALWRPFALGWETGGVWADDR